MRETIGFITQRFRKLSREKAYMIPSIAVDYHVTRVVDGTMGVHGMIPKAIFTSQLSHSGRHAARSGPETLCKERQPRP